MKKAKIFTSALLGVVMCTGLICALTANAVEAPNEPEKIAANTQAFEQDTEKTLSLSGRELMEEFTRRVVRGEDFEQVASDLGIPISPSGPHVPIKMDENELKQQVGIDSQTSEQDAEKTLSLSVRELMEEFTRRVVRGEDFEQAASDLGIPISPSGPHVPIEEEEQELETQGASRFIGTFPTSSTTLPSGMGFSNLKPGYGAYSPEYFAPDTNTLNVVYQIYASDTNDYTFKYTEICLYRQLKYVAGSTAWEYVTSCPIGFRNEVSSACTFLNLSNNYVYCLKVNNSSEASSTGSNAIRGGISYYCL